MELTPVPIAELVEDMDLYPRHSVDPSHISTLGQALSAGAQLPPPVAEKSTKKIVDGWHRVRAYKRIMGPEAVIDVELREYASQQDLMLDAIAMNSTHGRQLDRIDQIRSIILAKRHGATPEAISVVLHITEKKVRELEHRTAFADGPGSVPGGSEVPLKRPALWKAGATLTPQQVEAHQSMPGTSLLLVARQLRLALFSGLANPADDRLRAELSGLVPVVQAWLKELPA